MRGWETVVVGIVLAASRPVLAQDKPTADELMARAGRYVIAFGDSFVNVVTEERYHQQISTFAIPGNLANGRGGSAPLNAPSSRTGATHRDLKSDFLLVTVPSSGEVVPFRDTFEVDGADVRDRQERLAKLFLQPLSSAFEQAEAITAESARYNIGNLTRTVNNPILPLALLHPANQPRFNYTVTRLDAPLGTEVWIVEYRERSKPTLIRGAADRDLPAHGRFWIERATGRVLKAELLLQEPNVTASITTSFHADTAFSMDVPSEMREEYRLRNSFVTGQATYGRFRRFNVNTEETLQR